MDAVPTAFFESHDGGCTGWAVAASTVSKKTCDWQACRDIQSNLHLPFLYMSVFLKNNFTLSGLIVKDKLQIWYSVRWWWNYNSESNAKSRNLKSLGGSNSRNIWLRPMMLRRPSRTAEQSWLWETLPHLPLGFWWFASSLWCSLACWSISASTFTWHFPVSMSVSKLPHFARIPNLFIRSPP